MMRILHVITGLPKAAGTSVFCVELCHALNQETAWDGIKHSNKNGVCRPPFARTQCVIAVCDPSSPDMYQPANQSSGTISMISIKSVLRGEPAFDLVHLHGLWHPDLHQVVTYAKRHRIPYVFSPHGMLTPCSLGQKRLKKWTALALYQYWDLRGAALIHVTAESELAVVRRLGLKQPVVVAPLGVNVPTEAPPFRHNNPRIALFVSRVHPKKGLFNLVDAWARVKPHGWKMVIAGPDQDGHAAEVMARAKAAGIDQDFEMLGSVYGKDKDDLYAKADLFVLPSYSENFGVVVIEALAHGCPVITTKGTPWQELQGWPSSAQVLKCESAVVGEVGGRKSEVGGEATSAFSLQPSALAANGRCGWWIDIGVEPLADALKCALSLTDEERHQLGLNGRRLVEAKYKWPAIADQMKRAYGWVLNDNDSKMDP